MKPNQLSWVVNEKNSPDLDNISMYKISQVIDFIIKPLTHIIIISIYKALYHALLKPMLHKNERTSHLRQNWSENVNYTHSKIKIVMFISVRKKGKQADLSNERPISLLPKSITFF